MEMNNAKEIKKPGNGISALKALLKTRPDKQEFVEFVKTKLEYHDDEHLADILLEVKCLLPYAVFLRKEVTIKKLLESKISVHSTLKGNITALHIAAEYADLSVIQMLINCGADIKAKDKNSQTPLFNFLFSNSINCRDGPKILQVLANPKKLLYKSDVNGFVPLFLAIECGNAALIEKLVDMKVDFSFKDRWSRSFLFFISTKEDPEVFVVLKRLKFDVNATDNNNITPLQLTIAGLNEHAIRFLIDKGADLKRVDKFHRTPLQKMTEKNQERPTTKSEKCLEIIRKASMSQCNDMN